MGSAIYGRLGTVVFTYPTNGTVTRTGTLPVHDTLAVQGGTVPPYIIYQLQAPIDLYTFGTVSGESADYLIKVVSDRQTPSYQAYPIYDQVHANFQDAPLTIVGSYPLRVRRRSRTPPYRDNDGFWHVGGIYRIDRWNT
jgi:hypothetical protein